MQSRFPDHPPLPSLPHFPLLQLSGILSKHPHARGVHSLLGQLRLGTPDEVQEWRAAPDGATIDTDLGQDALKHCQRCKQLLACRVVMVKVSPAWLLSLACNFSPCSAWDTSVLGYCAVMHPGTLPLL